MCLRFKDLVAALKPLPQSSHLWINLRIISLTDWDFCDISPLDDGLGGLEIHVNFRRLEKLQNGITIYKAKQIEVSGFVSVYNRRGLTMISLYEVCILSDRAPTHMLTLNHVIFSNYYWCPCHVWCPCSCFIGKNACMSLRGKSVQD